jgi:nucleoside-diphosphate-sugar epimerase
MKIAVTGGSGKLGRTVVAVLRQAGHDVVNLDVAGRRGPGFVRVDLTNYGETIDALFGENDPSAGPDQATKPAFDALVHLAAIPAPGILSDVATFHNNILSTFNVFQAARRAGIRNIVYASSETVLGLPFDVPPPYIPVDEEYPPRPESMYSLVKHLEEQMAIELVRWDPKLKIIALRFSNVMDPEDYAEPGAGGRCARAVPRVRRRCEPAQVEPLGLHRRQGWRPSSAQGPGARRCGLRQIHHRRRRHRYVTVQCRSGG